MKNKKQIFTAKTIIEAVLGCLLIAAASLILLVAASIIDGKAEASEYTQFDPPQWSRPMNHPIQFNNGNYWKDSRTVPGNNQFELQGFNTLPYSMLDIRINTRTALKNAKQKAIVVELINENNDLEYTESFVISSKTDCFNVLYQTQHGGVYKIRITVLSKESLSLSTKVMN